MFKRHNASPRRGGMFIDLEQIKIPGAVRRSGTQVELYPSRFIPLLRTAPEEGFGFLANYKHVTLTRGETEFASSTDFRDSTLVRLRLTLTLLD
jgi:hypothetical protein